MSEKIEKWNKRRLSYGLTVEEDIINTQELIRYTFEDIQRNSLNKVAVSILKPHYEELCEYLDYLYGLQLLSLEGNTQ